MSGASLQTAGQLRNVYPIISSQGISVSTVLSAVTTVFTDIPLTRQLPFDSTPDKSERVFIVLKDIFLVINADIYTGNPRLCKALAFIDESGNKHYIGPIGETFNGPFVVSFPSVISPEMAYNAQYINRLGRIEYGEVSSAMGDATAITVRLYANVGLYGNYAMNDNIQSITVE